jgi:hypothetical protein
VVVVLAPATGVAWLTKSVFRLTFVLPRDESNGLHYFLSGEPGEEKHVILDYRRERLYTEGREAAKALAAEITCVGYHH